MTHVLVVGGGIAGLAAAWEARAHGPVTLVEGSSRLGGKIETAPFAGLDVETGPDSFLARVPAATSLAEELGLPLVAPGTGAAWMWARGRLRPIPSGTVLGVPTDPWTLAGADVVPRWAAARAVADLVIPPRPFTGDASVGSFVRARMGRTVQLDLVDPLVGGINAGHSDELSAAVVAPQLLAAAQKGSLMRNLSRPVATGPVFLTPRRGLSELVDALGARLPDVILGDPVVGIARDGAGWAARLRSGRVLAASALVLATPPRAAASLLDGVSPSVATSLRAIRTSSVVLVTFAYGYVPLEGSGFLVPRSEHRLMTACTFVGNKWPHLRRPGITILRASAGRVDDDRAMHMDDESLVSRLHAEISLALGVRTPPLETRVQRWVDAFPQYEVGHLDRVAAMEAQLARDAPGVALAGAALRGVGIATCIAGGREAARRVTSPIGPLRE